MTFNTFIDLRKFLREIRDTVGFRWIALRSVDLSKPCLECIKKAPDNYDSPSGVCSRCLDIGFNYVDKLIKGYRFQATPGVDIAANVGPINIPKQNYILEWNTFPKSTDWILELDLDEVTQIPKQPFKITSAFKIEDANSLRGDNGRIEFWKCTVEERNLSLG